VAMVVPASRRRGQRERGVTAVDDFADFVTAALPGLLRYGHALTGNPHDAADLVQSVLEKIGSRWASVVRNTGDPLAYTRKAMANGHISRWRRARRENLVAELPDVAAAAERYSFDHEPLWQAVKALPPRQRAVIVLRYYDGLSEVDIASALGVSQEPSRARRARQCRPCGPGLPQPQEGGRSNEPR
jgi:RNA polymerase sigma-70 factor (sigma-E family)